MNHGRESKKFRSKEVLSLCLVQTYHSIDGIEGLEEFLDCAQGTLLGGAGTGM